LLLRMTNNELPVFFNLHTFKLSPFLPCPPAPLLSFFELKKNEKTLVTL
jgi:hypothetical protein